MKHKNGLGLLILLLIGTLVSSCQSEEEVTQDQLVLDEVLAGDLDGETVLGAKLEIPFTVDNMQKAYNNLIKNQSLTKKAVFKTLKKDGKIKASHYYYRFLPKNKEEYKKLVNDEVLDIVNVPLHYEIEESGEGYRDPSLGNNAPYTYQYTVFPVNYEFPKNIEHEKLEEFYFPYEERSVSSKNEIRGIHP